jgi:predicted O-linked N-acetylglucosamine transferase (SPINDLY family)
MLLAKFLTNNSPEEVELREKHVNIALELDPNDPEVHLLAGNVLFEAKSLNKSLYYFNKAISIDPHHNTAAANAIYIRQNLCIWGKEGSQYDKDMKSLVRIIENDELKKSQAATKVNVPVVQSSTNSKYNPQVHSQDTSIHPHMALAYDIPTKLKLLLNINLAEGEKKLALSRGLIPTNHSLLFDDYKNDFKRNEDGSISNTRIRVGYVCASFKTKAVIYLTQDLFRFHDKSKFDVYVFSTTGPGNFTNIFNLYYFLYYYLYYLFIYYYLNI